MTPSAEKRTLLPYILTIVLAAALFLPAGGARAQAQPEEETTPKTVVVLPWKVNAAGDTAYLKDAFTEMLTTRLQEKGFSVEGPSAAGSALSGRSAPWTEADARAAADALGADLALYGSLNVLGESVSLDARILDAAEGGVVMPFSATGQGLESVVEMAEKTAVETTAFAASAPVAVEPALTAPASPEAPIPPVAAPEEPGFFKKAERKAPLKKTERLDGMFIAMTTADLDGDGTTEVFLADSDKVVAAGVEPDGSLTILAEITGRGRVVNVSAVDTDGDGSPELYVSRVVDNRASSDVVEFSGGGYTVTVRGVKWLMRTMTIDGGTVLAGQGFRHADGFHGPVVSLERRGEGVASIGTILKDLPRDGDIYRTELVDLTSAEGAEAAVIDRDNHLRIFERAGNGWKELLRTEDNYGGTLNRIYFITNVPAPATPEGEPMPVELGITHRDLDGDGAAELIVRKNQPGGIGWWAKTPTSFKKGTLTGLVYEDGDLYESWSTAEVTGYIADFVIDDLDGDGVDEITMLMVEKTGFLLKKQKSYILSHEIDIK